MTFAIGDEAFISRGYASETLIPVNTVTTQANFDNSLSGQGMRDTLTCFRLIGIGRR